MNAINWFEIPVANFERAVAFYERIHDAPLSIDENFPGMRMAILPYAEPGVGGALVAGEHFRPHADGVRIYLNGGDNLAPMLERALAAGGRLVMAKTSIGEDIGYIALFADSEGNLIGLHSPQ